jgi:hypothetical protein
MERTPARPPGSLSVVRESFTQSEFHLEGAAATLVRRPCVQPHGRPNRRMRELGSAHRRLADNFGRSWTRRRDLRHSHRGDEHPAGLRQSAGVPPGTMRTLCSTTQFMRTVTSFSAIRLPSSCARPRIHQFLAIIAPSLGYVRFPDCDNPATAKSAMLRYCCVMQQTRAAELACCIGDGRGE